MSILKSLGKLKTIAGTSLFGTGDIPVLTSGDLSAGLATKQDSLISGTNIKTINGNSLLGSGDIVLSSSMNIDGGNASSIGIVMGIDGEGA